MEMIRIKNQFVNLNKVRFIKIHKDDNRIDFTFSENHRYECYLRGQDYEILRGFLQNKMKYYTILS